MRRCSKVADSRGPLPAVAVAPVSIPTADPRASHSPAYQASNWSVEVAASVDLAPAGTPGWRRAIQRTVDPGRHAW